ncbi:NADH-ubiquinone oxidoreductase [Cutibacterium acnes JCM 18909]|nr:NADH-ubiquinone oxidoreductase [Cutibacterium acnes JCM 18909]
MLAQRADTVWPGAADHAGSKSAGRRLPVGVPDPETWRRIKDGEDVPDVEVIAAVSGRRPRSAARRMASTASGRQA